MDHKAEQVMTAILALLAGTVGISSIHRGRDYNIPESDMPALLLTQGPDRKVSQTFTTNDWLLTVIVTGKVQHDSATDIEKELNEIRKQVHLKMMTDITQGGVCLNTEEGDTGDIISTSGGTQQVASQDWEWMIHYRRSINDPSV